MFWEHIVIPKCFYDISTISQYPVIKINMRAIRYFSKEIVTITCFLFFLFSFLQTTNMSIFTVKVATYQRNEKS